MLERWRARAFVLSCCRAGALRAFVLLYGRAVVRSNFEFVLNLGFGIWDLRASRGTSEPDVRA